MCDTDRNAIALYDAARALPQPRTLMEYHLAMSLFEKAILAGRDCRCDACYQRAVWLYTTLMHPIPADLLRDDAEQDASDDPEMPGLVHVSL